MPNNSKELQDILYRILRILLSTQVTLWVVWRQIQRGYALFLYNAKLVRQMPNNNKQAIMAKNSSRYARIWKGQARLLGLITITRTFDNFNDACAWYDKYQEGWRYNNAVAVLWQGVTRRTPKRFLHDAMLGGKEWELVKERGIVSQAQCDYLLNSLDYEIL